MNMKEFLKDEAVSGLMDIDAYNDGIDQFLELAKETRIKKRLVDWLESIGYFLAPAAVKYHGNKPGGLLAHSMEVAKTLKDITVGMGLEWDYEDSPIIVGLLHDLCKVDEYFFEPDQERTLYAEDKPICTSRTWKPAYNKNQLYKGHGDKSCRLISRFCMRNQGEFFLTSQEELCITYHMGAFTDKDDWKYFSEAVRMDENVQWTHTADMLASSRGI